jgi:phosphopantothenoylcysteine synthetase/decarboxylase
MSLNHKKIVVGVSGSIAAYKAVLLVRELIARGAEVRVVMTQSATRFVGPATFSGITGKPAIVDLWDASYPGEVHVDLARWADAIVVAPATANLLARAASGMADDALLATLSCARSPVLYAPAMHERMWLSAPTKRNVEQLVRGGARIVGPLRGALASGEIGWGRLEEPALIADAVASALRALQDGADQRRPHDRRHRPGALHHQPLERAHGLCARERGARPRRGRRAGVRPDAGAAAEQHRAHRRALGDRDEDRDRSPRTAH